MQSAQDRLLLDLPPSILPTDGRSHPYSGAHHIQSVRACLAYCSPTQTNFLRSTATSIATLQSFKSHRPPNQPAPLNFFPFALNVFPGRFLHFLNSLGLLFSCNNADAITSALGMSGSVATEKHVDLPWWEIRRTNLESTKKFLRPTLSQ